MTWTAYRVTLRLLAPMHIGWRKLGNLQQTRPYVTGRNLWGTLTARITREQGKDNYTDIGKLVNQQLAFTYFYPSTQPDTITHWPWSDQWDKFAWTFLSSYTSTALENGRGAEAGSLHETEFISPHTRDGEPVNLVGYIFEKKGCQLEWRQPLLNKIQLGGERSYGWGRVRLEGECEPVTDKKCFDYQLNLDGACPQITVPNGKQLLAHTEAESFSDVSNGTIEPLVGRETNDKESFGKKHSQAEICWTPGSIVKVDKEKPFEIHARGIWKVTTT